MNFTTIRSSRKWLKRAFTRTFACGALLAVPACNIPQLRVADPGPALPTTFKGETSAENVAHLGIDEFFDDPLLTGLLAEALTNSLELKMLNQEVQIARNEIMARRGAYLPFMTGGAGSGLGRASLFTPAGAVEDQLDIVPGQSIPNPVPNHYFGLNFMWQIDIWRELRNARDAAIERYYAALERRNFFITRLVAEIAEKYYVLMALDNRIQILDQTIALQQASQKVAEANKAAARGTELGVQRFLAEVRKNQSEKLVVIQEIIETENRINFLAGRYPQPVQRSSPDYVDLKLHQLDVGVPADLLLNRPDIRQAERELTAAGLDVKVARAHFFPRLDLNAGVGYGAFNPRYIFNPEALFYNLAGDLMVPLINKKAIRAEYLTANAAQLEKVYNYQKVVLDAYTEVINRLTKVKNYGESVDIKKQQLDALRTSVDVASKLFQNARAEYIDVLFAQRDLMDGRMAIIQTKREQLSAIVNTYQALGGGYIWSPSTTGRANPAAMPAPIDDQEIP